MKILLNGKSNLAERFAEINIAIVREDLKEKQRLQQLLPAKMRKACKIAHLPSKLAKFIAMRAAS